MISHVTCDSNNDIKMSPRMPKIITILARIENRPTPLSSVILYLLTKINYFCTAFLGAVSHYANLRFAFNNTLKYE